MKTKKGLMALLFMLLLFAAGCAAGDNKKNENAQGKETAETENDEKKTESDDMTDADPGTKPKADAGAFYDGYCDFALKLMQKVADRENNENNNILISPFSVESACAMLVEGAGSDTLSQMENAMGCQKDTLIAGLSDYRGRMDKIKDVTITSAASMWIREEFRPEVKESYIETCKKELNSEVFCKPFNEDTRKQCNEWCADKTNGMIPEFLAGLNPGSDMLLVDATAFTGAWETPYSDDQVMEGETFYASDGSEQEVSLMHGIADGYLKAGDTDGLVKYYGGKEYAFFAFAPNQGAIKDFLKKLDAAGLKENLQNPNEDVIVTAEIPMMEVDYDTDLTKALDDMGMGVFAKGDAADLSAISNQPLEVSAVNHVTHLEIDQFETKAAAVTDIEMEVTSIFPEEEPERVNIRLDHPFVYGIADMKTGMPIFIGIQNSF